MIEGLIALSQFKFGVLEMTVSFFDFLIVDADTITFLNTNTPRICVSAPLVVAFVVIPLLVLAWRFDPFRVRFLPAVAGAGTCLADGGSHERGAGTAMGAISGDQPHLELRPVGRALRSPN